MRVLVGYATEHGSTAEIAKRIASVLGKRGVRAETLPSEKVVNVESYGGFVLGSAVHGRRWLPEAGHFVDSNVDTFATRPVWLFSVGMPAALPRRFHSWAATEEKRVVGDMLRHVEPRGARLFSGVSSPHTPRRSAACCSGPWVAGSATTGIGRRSKPGRTRSPTR